MARQLPPYAHFPEQGFLPPESNPYGHLASRWDLPKLHHRRVNPCTRTLSLNPDLDRPEAVELTGSEASNEEWDSGRDTIGMKYSLKIEGPVLSGDP